MSDPVTSKVIDAITHVLSNDTAIVPAQVPAANLRPREDPIEALPGNALYYGWAAGSWDRKRRRGEGTIAVVVAATKNNQEATEIMDLVRKALTPSALTYTGSPVRVARFAEDGGFSDSGTTDSNRFLVSTSFEVKFTGA
jgi:hypothetical protein